MNFAHHQRAFLYEMYGPDFLLFGYDPGRPALLLAFVENSGLPVKFGGLAERSPKQQASDNLQTSTLRHQELAPEKNAK